MRNFLLYIVIAIPIVVAFWVFLSLFLSSKDSIGIAIIIIPCAIWRARLLVASRRGRISRRFLGINDGSFRIHSVCIFNPEIYVREPGFSNFRGYLVKESLLCGFVTFLFLITTAVPAIFESLGLKFK